MDWCFWVPWLMWVVRVKRRDRIFIVNELTDHPGCAKRLRRQFRRLALWFIVAILFGLGGSNLLDDVSWPIRVIPIMASLMFYGLGAYVYFTITAERHRRGSSDPFLN